MVWHEIQDQFETARVYSGEQRVEIDHRAEQRIDAGIIANVIAKILHRRRKYWREPDRINAKLSEIGKPTDDARQIADAIAIAVLKRARVDLINDSGFPPSVGHDDFKIPQLSPNSATAHDFSTRRQDTIKAQFIGMSPLSFRHRFVSSSGPGHRCDTSDTHKPPSASNAFLEHRRGYDPLTTNSPKAGQLPQQLRQRSKPPGALNPDCARTARSCFASHILSLGQTDHAFV